MKEHSTIRLLLEGNEELSGSVECEYHHFDDEVRQLLDENAAQAESAAELEAELKESARLHGMGSSREARLNARIAELEAQCAQWSKRNLELEMERRQASERVSPLEEELKWRRGVHGVTGEVDRLKAEMLRAADEMDKACAEYCRGRPCFCSDCSEMVRKLVSRQGHTHTRACYGTEINGTLDRICEQGEDARQEIKISCGGVEGHATSLSGAGAACPDPGVNNAPRPEQAGTQALPAATTVQAILQPRDPGYNELRFREALEAIVGEGWIEGEKRYGEFKGLSEAEIAQKVLQEIPRVGKPEGVHGGLYPSTAVDSDHKPPVTSTTAQGDPEK